MPDALLSLGSNQGDPVSALDRAVELIANDLQMIVKQRSSFYRTKPVGPVPQDDFVNMAVQIETALDPVALVHHLLEIESRLGRDRTKAVRWGPRVIDIDLILYDQVSLTTADVEVPHPRFRERAFVLIPLAEIAPTWRVGADTLHDLAQAIGHDGVEKLR